MAKSKDPHRHPVVLLAEGFGSGRSPIAPGTFGTLPGFVLFALLLLPGNVWLFFAGMIAMIGVSVWASGQAEQILSQRDPGSVVIDEIIAIPVCFAGWVVWRLVDIGAMPGVGYFFQREWLGVIGIFVLFRIFDIWKPWPVGPSQKLYRGWGVTMDDVLAAGYVNLIVLVVLFVTR